MLSINSKIYVAGHSGMVGSAMVRKLSSLGFKNLLFRKSSELDLTNQDHVNLFFKKERPEIVFLAAAKVGGIMANTGFPAEFIYQNLMIEANIIHASYKCDVKKLLFLGSSCIYPKFADQPMREEALLSGYLEKTNQPYAVAKIAGIELCDSYRKQYGCNFFSVMPTNLYGPNDNYDLNSSHVLPALLRKFVLAKKNGDSQVTIWGSGTPKREFLHADDLADACVFLMQSKKTDIGSDDYFGLINVGSGEEVSISDLAALIGRLTEFKGQIIYDKTKPDGTPRKLLDSSRLMDLGWHPSISLEGGLKNLLTQVSQLPF
ncbi:MAG: GDP-L-fucose synthase [Bacteroidetes bacterium]|nr:GDP-L-fucose synthase [Bacteroidota bacterium]